MHGRLDVYICESIICGGLNDLCLHTLEFVAGCHVGQDRGLAEQSRLQRLHERRWVHPGRLRINRLTRHMRSPRQEMPRRRSSARKVASWLAVLGSPSVGYGALRPHLPDVSQLTPTVDARWLTPQERRHNDHPTSISLSCTIPAANATASIKPIGSLD